MVKDALGNTLKVGDIAIFKNGGRYGSLCLVEIKEANDEYKVKILKRGSSIRTTHAERLIVTQEYSKLY